MSSEVEWKTLVTRWDKRAQKCGKTGILIIAVVSLLLISAGLFFVYAASLVQVDFSAQLKQQISELDSKRIDYQKQMGLNIKQQRDNFEILRKYLFSHISENNINNRDDKVNFRDRGSSITSLAYWHFLMEKCCDAPVIREISLEDNISFMFKIDKKEDIEEIITKLNNIPNLISNKTSVLDSMNNNNDSEFSKLNATDEISLATISFRQSYDVIENLHEKINSVELVIKYLQEQTKNDLLNLDPNEKELFLIQTQINRFGATIIILILVTTLIPLYKYNMRLASYYYGRSDALTLMATGFSSKLEIADAMDRTTPSFDFSRERAFPIEKLAEALKLLQERTKTEKLTTQS